MFFFQLSLRASDSGVPPKYSEASFKVFVSREQNTPQFELAQYDVKMNESTDVGFKFVTVQASDPDVSISSECFRIWIY